MLTAIILPLLPYVISFPSGTVVKNPSANAGDAGVIGSVPGSGRSLEEEMANHSSILTWEILWTKEPGGLQSMGSIELDTTEQAHLFYLISFPSRAQQMEKRN